MAVKNNKITIFKEWNNALIYKPSAIPMRRGINKRTKGTSRQLNILFSFSEESLDCKFEESTHSMYIAGSPAIAAEGRYDFYVVKIF